MFDYICIKKELPLNEELKGLDIKWNEIEYQTKDLENYLGHYTINEDGWFWKKVAKALYSIVGKLENIRMFIFRNFL